MTLPPGFGGPGVGVIGTLVPGRPATDGVCVGLGSGVRSSGIGVGAVDRDGAIGC